MTPHPFASTRHEIASETAGTSSLALTPLGAEHAERLGAGFAAIDPWARYPYPASLLERYFATEEAGAPRFAVWSGGELAGAAGLRLNWLRGPYVQFLGVLPEFQRRRLGASVLGWIESEARHGSERNLWVAASDFNVDAIRFYETHGFALAAPLPDLIRDGRTELLLRKQL